MRITRRQLKKIISESFKRLKLNESEIHVEDGIARDDEGNEFPTDMPDGVYPSRDFKFKGGDRYYHQGPGGPGERDPDYDDPDAYYGPSSMGPDYDARRSQRGYGYGGGSRGRRY